jgi:hypothetical protein
MTTLATRQNLLDAGGYVYNIDREVYFNRRAKKIFSVDFLEDHKGPKSKKASTRKPTDGSGGSISTRRLLSP